MTPRSLILIKAFWFYGHFSEAMSFSRFALLSQKSQFTYRKFSIVWLPRVKCLLLFCKAKPAWIKRSHSLRNFAALQSGGATQRNSSLHFERDFWYKRSKCWKGHCLRKIALKSKRLNQNHWSSCRDAGKRMFYSLLHSLTRFSPWFLWN